MHQAYRSLSPWWMTSRVNHLVAGIKCGIICIFMKEATYLKVAQMH